MSPLRKLALARAYENVCSQQALLAYQELRSTTFAEGKEPDVLSALVDWSKNQRRARYNDPRLLPAEMRAVLTRPASRRCLLVGD